MPRWALANSSSAAWSGLEQTLHFGCSFRVVMVEFLLIAINKVSRRKPEGNFLP